VRTLRTALGMIVLGLLVPTLGGDGAQLEAQTPMHNCSFCHNLHGGSFTALSDYAVSEDLCLSCHGAAGPAQVDRDGTLVDVPKEGRGADAGSGFLAHNGSKHAAPTNCWNCHNHEGEAEAGSYTNLKMIQATMPTPNSGDWAIEFTAFSGPKSFADGDATYDGPCEACHTGTDQHNNTGTVGAHNGAADCTVCHKHDTGFQGLGGPCADCHDTGGEGTTGPNNRRPIIPEFSRRSHHVSGTYQDSDCEACHDMSEHQQGTVRLKDADTGAAIVYDGQASTLEPFCLSCHDADGSVAAGGPPFSDGLTPPDADSNWAAASHNATGGYTCWDCHDNPHGSLKANLLAPHDVAANGTTFYEEEEGFCFDCHDSDGPAGSDVSTSYGTTTLWLAAERGDNASGKTMNLNDRHDVTHADQTTSGAKIECADCHDPHSATAAQPWKTDPDPGDGRVPGTGAVYSGADFMSEFCMDCHDGSFPATVTAPTDALIDVRTTWATDAMGGGNGNANLKSGYGWVDNMLMPCAACHDPHVSGNLFHGDDVIYSLDGTTPVPSDGASGYSITDNSIKSTPVNGYDWCNTCHTSSMGDKKDNCFACHFHGTRW